MTSITIENIKQKHVNCYYNYASGESLSLESNGVMAEGNQSNNFMMTGVNGAMVEQNNFCANQMGDLQGGNFQHMMATDGQQINNYG